MFTDFLNEIESKEINIGFSNGKLQYSGPEQHINEELIQKLIQYRPKLVKYFWPKNCVNMFPLNTDGNLIPFVLLHGGSYFQLSEVIGNNRPLYGFMFIGSEAEKQRYRKVEDFARNYLVQMQKILPRGPYLLGGMSMGGTLAFEMAMQLQENGYEVPLVIMVDSTLPAYEPIISTENIIRRNYFKFYKFARETYIWARTALLFAKYEVFSKTYEKLPIEMRTSYMVRIYDQLVRKYKPQNEYKGEILLFKASENNYNSEYLGWEKLCKNISIVHYTGTHGSMFVDLEVINLIKTKIGEKLDEINY